MGNDLTATTAAEAAAILGRCASLHDVLRWALVQRPAWTVVDVVGQDEFTNDVLLACSGVPEVIVLDAT